MRMLKMVSQKNELPWAIAIPIPNKTKSKEDESKSKVSNDNPIQDSHIDFNMYVNVNDLLRAKRADGD